MIVCQFTLNAENEAGPEAQKSWAQCTLFGFTASMMADRTLGMRTVTIDRLEAGFKKSDFKAWNFSIAALEVEGFDRASELDFTIVKQEMNLMPGPGDRRINW